MLRYDGGKLDATFSFDGDGSAVVLACYPTPAGGPRTHSSPRRAAVPDRLPHRAARPRPTCRSRPRGLGRFARRAADHHVLWLVAGATRCSASRSEPRSAHWSQPATRSGRLLAGRCGSPPLPGRPGAGCGLRADDRRRARPHGVRPVSCWCLPLIWVALEIRGLELRCEYGYAARSTPSTPTLMRSTSRGVNFFTVGFGDIVAAAAAHGCSVMFAAFTGVTTMALVVGYLPTLYGAYSERAPAAAARRSLGHRDDRGRRSRPTGWARPHPARHRPR